MVIHLGCAKAHLCFGHDVYWVMFRELNKQEKWLSQYEGLFNKIVSSYEEIIYEYTNDLSFRLFIQQRIESSDSENGGG